MFGFAKKSIYRTMCNNLQIKNRSSHIQHQQTLDHRLYRASQYVEEAEAEIDILEDLEQLNVKTTNDAYDDDDDSAFIIIESKSGAKDNVIESFFNDPKKFTKSPPRLQSSAVDSSSSSFKKFNKLSQKERKKQQKQQHSKLYYIYIFKTKIKKLIWCIEPIATRIFCTSYIHFFPFTHSKILNCIWKMFKKCFSLNSSI